MPKDTALARLLDGRVKNLVTILLLPPFFAFAGMRTRIDLLGTPSLWLICALIVLVATVGKFGGTCVAARLSGMESGAAACLPSS
jgi:Kef-type K+ transport system membrane component KefB